MAQVGGWVLAQGTGQHSAAILQWLLVIAVLAVAIVIVAVVVRRRLLGDADEEQTSDPGFLLADLRRMHREGQLSDEEFAAAKAGMIARSRAMLHEEEAEGGDESRPFPTDVGETDAKWGDAADDEAGDDETGDAEPDKTEPR